MEQIIKDFGIQPILLAAQVVNFLVLLYILKRFLYKPILKVLEQRKQTIAQSLENAQQIELKLKKTEEDREQALIKAAQEAKNILEGASKTASEIVQEAHIKAQKDIEELIIKNTEAMRLEREKLHQEIREELADLVVTAVQKVSGKVLTKKDQKEIIEKSIKDLA